MAQWIGFRSGHTHDTKVRDSEDSLRHAVLAVSGATPVDRDRKVQAMRRLAHRVLNCRLKALRARIVALTEPGKLTQDEVARLQESEQVLRSQGIEGILREFGVKVTLRA
jgi:hypothetical protein